MRVRKINTSTMQGKQSPKHQTYAYAPRQKGKTNVRKYISKKKTEGKNKRAGIQEPKIKTILKNHWSAECWIPKPTSASFPALLGLLLDDPRAVLCPEAGGGEKISASEGGGDPNSMIRPSPIEIPAEPDLPMGSPPAPGALAPDLDLVINSPPTAGPVLGLTESEKGVGGACGACTW